MQAPPSSVDIQQAEAAFVRLEQSSPAQEPAYESAIEQSVAAERSVTPIGKEKHGVKRRAPTSPAPEEDLPAKMPKTRLARKQKAPQVSAVTASEGSPAPAALREHAASLVLENCNPKPANAAKRGKGRGRGRGRGPAAAPIAEDESDKDNAAPLMRRRSRTRTEDSMPQQLPDPSTSAEKPGKRKGRPPKRLAELEPESEEEEELAKQLSIGSEGDTSLRTLRSRKQKAQDPTYMMWSDVAEESDEPETQPPPRSRRRIFKVPAAQVETTAAEIEQEDAASEEAAPTAAQAELPDPSSLVPSPFAEEPSANGNAQESPEPEPPAVKHGPQKRVTRSSSAHKQLKTEDSGTGRVGTKQSPPVLSQERSLSRHSSGRGRRGKGGRRGRGRSRIAPHLNASTPDPPAEQHLSIAQLSDLSNELQPAENLALVVTEEVAVPRASSPLAPILEIEG